MSNQNIDDAKNPDKGAHFLVLANTLLSDLPKRSQEIIKKRYGISVPEPETLEQIGREYKITRERVRQIIVDALKKINKKIDGDDFKSIEDNILFTIVENNGIIEEEKIVLNLSGGNKNVANAVVFVQMLSKRISVVEEKGLIKKSWLASREVINRVNELSKEVQEIFKREQKPLKAEEIVKKIQAKKSEFSETEIVNLLDVMAGFAKNAFDKWGLFDWKEINPKGTREKIYIVLKERNKPLHFVEIAQHIDQYQLSKKKAHPQTVHNELIKDNRFVLIGRGIYALKEWGYQEGTVKDILKDILNKSKKPLTRDEILEQIFKMRKVKKSTVMINLNNPAYFTKEKNHYSIK